MSLGNAFRQAGAAETVARLGSVLSRLYPGWVFQRRPFAFLKFSRINSVF
jgi:hypothetical protein